MRIKISHQTTFSYAPAARSIIQNLRLTPRSFESQYVLRWRVGVDVDCSLRQSEDSLGNVVHAFSYQGAIERFTISAVGEVAATDAVGVVRGAVEPLPAQMFLRASPLAQANGALREFALEAVGTAADAIERLHRLMDAIHAAMTFETQAMEGKGGAGEAFALRRGGAQDYAHLFIACARWLGVPARFVSGYLAPRDAPPPQGLYAWAEAEAPVIGWVAFDPVRNQCADDAYVRVAVGFDALGAAPFRVAQSGGGGETVAAAVRIEQAAGQSQN
ncbi:MAG: transglutaminase family protein [Roseiarcus sp.]|jgi:transglutaminase-like putative cysteine protease